MHPDLVYKVDMVTKVLIGINKTLFNFLVNHLGFANIPQLLLQLQTINSTPKIAFVVLPATWFAFPVAAIILSVEEVGVNSGKGLTHINNFTLNYSRLSINDFGNKGISIRRPFSCILIWHSHILLYD